MGPGVTRFAAGDRVLGHAVGVERDHNNPAEGAFQDYRTASRLSTHHGSPRPTGQAVLVWGGSTSVGSNAIQLAVAAGYEVITTCSPKNFDYVKRLGASQAFDYRGNAVVGEIVAALKGKKLAGAFAVAAGSVALCAEVLSAREGGEVLVFATAPGVSLDDLFRQHPSSVRLLRAFAGAGLSTVALMTSSPARSRPASTGRPGTPGRRARPAAHPVRDGGADEGRLRREDRRLPSRPPTRSFPYLEVFKCAFSSPARPATSARPSYPNYAAPGTR